MPPARVLADPIDQVLALDPGGRGISAIAAPGAAAAAARALQHARRALITTGFVVQPGMPETDGPPGAAVLGRALRRLGARVRYVTDPLTVPLLEAALKALDEPAEVLEYPDAADAAAVVLGAERPTHLIAIERPGRSRSGDYLNARAESVAAWNRPIDELFCWSGEAAPGSGRGRAARDARGAARAAEGSASLARGSGRVVEGSASRGFTRRRTGLKRPVTVGVGDGGNEIGMGNVRARLARQGPVMARIASVVRVDHLVAAGTSNWGAYGVVAALGRDAGRRLLHSPADERRLIQACVDAGGYDGITRRREPTVDGLPADLHAAMVELLGYHGTIPWRPAARPVPRPIPRRGA